MPASCFVFIAIVFLLIAVFVAAAMAYGKARDDAQTAYRKGLLALRSDPGNAELRARVLELGRAYANAERQVAGITAKFNEVALMNDIQAACAATSISVLPRDATGAGRGEAASAVAGKSAFTVVLTDIGHNKINVIKAVREVTGFGLREAKDLVENAAAPIKTVMLKDDAATIKRVLEEAGATVEIKSAFGPPSQAERGALTIAQRLEMLKSLKDQGVIDDDEYRLKRSEILGEL